MDQETDQEKGREKGKHIYVAGPYKSNSIHATNQNIFAMRDACDFLLQYNFVPFFPLLCHLWDLISPRAEDEWLALNIAWINRCDIFTYLDGDSEGVKIEREHAFDTHIPIYSYATLRILLLEGESIVTRRKRTDDPGCTSTIFNKVK